MTDQALSSASCEGDIEFVKLLIEKGIAADAEGGKCDWTNWNDVNLLLF